MPNFRGFQMKLLTVFGGNKKSKDPEYSLSLLQKASTQPLPFPLHVSFIPRFWLACFPLSRDCFPDGLSRDLTLTRAFLSSKHPESTLSDFEKKNRCLFSSLIKQHMTVWGENMRKDTEGLLEPESHLEIKGH